MSDITYAYNFQKSPQFAHIEWIELHGDGIMHECAVLKEDQTGNKLYFPINHLDKIDRERLGVILMDRNARNLQLWDLMSQKTLGNGMNALQYFHQFVKILAPNGKIIDPKSGVIGTPVTGSIKLNATPEV